MKNDELDFWEETGSEEMTELETPVEVVEEYIDIDDDLIELEQNKDLIRLDMNLVEYPIFSKNTRRKQNQIVKYNFKADGSAYIEIEPPFNSTIPGEFEERVFIALTKIMRDEGYERIFYVTNSDILKNLGSENYYNNTYRKKIKEAMKRMSKTKYKFKNSLYSNMAKSILEDEIYTSIMNIRVITKSDISDDDNKLFNDGRIKEVYQIEVSEHFYNNIIQKGYLVFDAIQLLGISDSITRSVFTMITKWRNKDLYLRRPAFYIARRIPLKWDKRIIGRTIKRIEKSCIDLKELGLIEGYRLIRNDKWEKTEFEFYFSEDHNKIKQDNFFAEKKEFGLITHIEDRIAINQKAKQNIDDIANENEIGYIINLFSKTTRNLKTFEKTIKESLYKYGYKYVKYAVEYTVMNSKSSQLSYLKKCLKEDWAEEYRLEKLKLQEKDEKLIQQKIVNEKKNKEQAEMLMRSDQYINEFYESYLVLDEDIKAEIDKKAYELFLNEINGFDNQINSDIFAKTKKTYLAKITEEFIKYDSEEAVIVEDEKLDNNYLNNSNIVIDKNYDTISLFLLDLMRELKRIEIDEVEDIVKLVSTLNYFEGEVSGKYLSIKYEKNKNSLFEIKS